MTYQPSCIIYFISIVRVLGIDLLLLVIQLDTRVIGGGRQSLNYTYHISYQNKKMAVIKIDS